MKGIVKFDEPKGETFIKDLNNHDFAKFPLYDYKISDDNKKITLAVFRDNKGNGNISYSDVQRCVMQEFNRENNYPKEQPKEGNILPLVERKEANPNAYYLKNSQYLRKEECDSDMIKSPSRGGYLIPMSRSDLYE